MTSSEGRASGQCPAHRAASFRTHGAPLRYAGARAHPGDPARPGWPRRFPVPARVGPRGPAWRRPGRQPARRCPGSTATAPSGPGSPPPRPRPPAAPRRSHHLTRPAHSRRRRPRPGPLLGAMISRHRPRPRPPPLQRPVPPRDCLKTAPHLATAGGGAAAPAQPLQQGGHHPRQPSPGSAISRARRDPGQRPAAAATPRSGTRRSRHPPAIDALAARPGRAGSSSPLPPPTRAAAAGQQFLRSAGTPAAPSGGRKARARTAGCRVRWRPFQEERSHRAACRCLRWLCCRDRAGRAVEPGLLLNPCHRGARPRSWAWVTPRTGHLSRSHHYRILDPIVSVGYPGDSFPGGTQAPLVGFTRPAGGAGFVLCNGCPPDGSQPPGRERTSS